MSYKYPGFTLAHPFPEPRPKELFGYHGGADYAARAGTPVPAQYAGTVFRSGHIHGYGLAVIVETQTADGPIYTLYGHLGPNGMPEAKARIEPGQPIGEVASKAFNETFGLHYNPHLHLEIISDKADIKRTGALNTWSSDLTHRANPETFDINHPKFPYEITGRPPKPGVSPSAPLEQKPYGPKLPLPQVTPGNSMQPPSSKPSLNRNGPLDIRPPQFRGAPVSGGGGVPPPPRFGSPIYFGEPSSPRQTGPFTLPAPDRPGSGTGNGGAFDSDAHAFNDYGIGNVPSNGASVADRFGNRTSVPDGFTPRYPSLPLPIPQFDRPLGFIDGKLAPLPLFGPAADPDASGHANGLPAPVGAAWDDHISRASDIDAGAPVVTIAPSDRPYSPGGQPGLLAALAGIDPRHPNQFASPPLDDVLRSFYRDDPVQPWFVQGRR
jgi:hypothetical protein